MGGRTSRIFPWGIENFAGVCPPIKNGIPIKSETHDPSSQRASQPVSQPTPWRSTTVSQQCRPNTFRTHSQPLSKGPNHTGGAREARPPYSYFLYTVADCVCGTCSDDTAEKQSCGATVLAGWLAGWLAGMFMNFKFPGGVSPPMHPWTFQFPGGGAPPMHPPTPQGRKGSLHGGYTPPCPLGVR